MALSTSSLPTFQAGRRRSPEKNNPFPPPKSRLRKMSQAVSSVSERSLSLERQESPTLLESFEDILLDDLPVTKEIRLESKRVLGNKKSSPRKRENDFVAGNSPTTTSSSSLRESSGTVSTHTSSSLKLVYRKRKNSGEVSTCNSHHQSSTSSRLEGAGTLRIGEGILENAGGRSSTRKGKSGKETGSTTAWESGTTLEDINTGCRYVSLGKREGKQRILVVPPGFDVDLTRID